MLKFFYPKYFALFCRINFIQETEYEKSYFQHLRSVLLFAPVQPINAQVLDGETAQEASFPSSGGLSFDETDKNEALFNEMFGDHPEIRENVENMGNFENTAQKAAEKIKQTGATAPSAPADGILKPLNGDMLIGVSKGSFKVFQDMTGRTNCTFGVTLKSNLDRELKTMGLQLVYPHRVFAFIFRNVAEKGSQERFITTTGDICYNLAGVPDIEVNLCRIKNAADNECAKRIKWSNDLESPDPSKNPY